MAPSDRRQFLLHCGHAAARAGLASAGAVLVSQAAPAFGQVAAEDPELTAAAMITAEAQEAIDQGLEWLASRQNEDGSFGTGVYARNTGAVSLAGMAFMAGGNTPGRGKYGENVSRAIRFLMESAQESGFLVAKGASSHGPMYEHGFATLFLAEAYGMTPDSQVRETLAKAVKIIVSTQNSDGGWRYQPTPREADISVTISQVMALRAARNAGVFVPNDTIDRCVEYVKRSQNSDGGFMYMITGGPSAFPRSAAGVVALYSAGIYEGDELEKGLDYLRQHLPRNDAFGRESHFFYGQYYAVQAMWHAGGRHWARWFPAIRDVLVARQRNDGSWIDSFSPEYGTAMACLILQMPNNYLPIFQR